MTMSAPSGESVTRLAGLLLLPAVLLAARFVIRGAVRDGMIAAALSGDMFDEGPYNSSDRADTLDEEPEMLPPVLTSSLFAERCRTGGMDEIDS